MDAREEESQLFNDDPYQNEDQNLFDVNVEAAANELPALDTTAFLKTKHVSVLNRQIFDSATRHFKNGENETFEMKS